ncbi:MAG: ferredoxin--NADP+ reductase [Motiliproteus sp.]|jgi:ferredoxin--NADP+ reductase
MAQWQNGRVRETIRWSETLYSLRVDTARIDFKAGQYTRLGLDMEGTLIARPYSFVNPPSDPLLEFYVNTVPDGPLSNRLLNLNPGDQLQVSSTPSGFLVLDEIPSSRDLWLLATGTAIGPFLSILATAEPWQRFERIVLVYGVSYQADLSYRALLDQFARAHPEQFVWLPSVSRDPQAGDISGRIPAAIAEGILEQRAGLTLSAEHSQVMICGNPEMVKESLVLLTERGLAKNLRRKPGQVTVERYW